MVELLRINNDMACQARVVEVFVGSRESEGKGKIRISEGEDKWASRLQTEDLP